MQQFGGPADVLIRVAEQPGGDAAQQAAVQKVRGALGDAVEYRRVEVVGPRVSGELLAYGMLGLMLAIFAILIYLWFRFEWQFALGAMIANVHDIVLTIGFMSITQVDFDLTSIAALLTILGYSLNDTVVIYDRIREMLRRYKKMPMPQLLNESINSTLSRSIITHVTVTLALLALLLFGGHAIHSFTAVMMFGVVLVGTYTSIFIAAPILIYLGVGEHRDGGRAARSRQQEEVADGQIRSDAPHLPRSAPIEAYGKGGFAFADMSHRGSLLCLPDAIWAWPVTRPDEIDEYSLARVFKAANAIDTLIVGTGTEVWLPPRGLREALRAVQGGAGPDADGACDPHLQHHDGRAPARRGGADRGAMSATAAHEGFRRLLRRSGAQPRFCPLRLDAVRAGGPAPRAAGDLRLQCRDFARARAGQPAAAGRNAAAMVDRHAGGRRPWRRRGQSGRGRTAAGDPRLPPAGRAAVAPDR